MRFTVRPGSDPVARADATLLKAIGLPYGGVVAVGRTHLLIKAGETTEASAILLGPLAQANAATAPGRSIEVTRAVLSAAQVVAIDAEALPADPKDLARALQGRPLSSGDRVAVTDLEFTVLRVEPPPAGLVGPGTRFTARDQPYLEQAAGQEPGFLLDEPRAAPTRRDALLAGLEAELDLLTGWLNLLTSPQDLPTAWGLPRVAGVILEGPHGCGKSELVEAAASAAGARVVEVAVDQVFKPERLLDLLEKSIKTTVEPAVIFVDRLEVVAGEEGMAPFRTQVAAVLRWFLDAIVERRGIATVLGVESRAHLDPAVAGSPLLPRSLSIPPPDLTRRRLLFQAALARVPAEDLDFDLLAARSAGFSGSDVIAAVMHASTRVTRSGAKVSEGIMVEAIEHTTPSLGSVPLGELPSFGFDQVADLEEVKQRLTEAVIWPITDPERFRVMGIDPPRGILLYGPPGTGKTYVVRALAKEAGAAFFSVKGAELLDKYVGESERGVREVFARARAAAPSIIFFDEIDALAPVRGRSTTTVTDSVVAALLTEIDGIAARGQVAVIGATNRRDLIDPALLRAGRFETQIELGLPEAKARRKLLDISDVPFGEDVDLDELARAAEGLSFADISGVLREAALEALRADRSARKVSRADLQRALELLRKTRASTVGSGAC
jgi:transitional endoplasmic reticulum ATPase